MGHYIIMSASDLRRLSDREPFPIKRIDSPAGCSINALDALISGRCPFLTLTGCVLSEDMRPLVCRMFPLTYTLEKKEIKFYLSKKCPYVSEVNALSNWISETKRASLIELGRDWTRKELRSYGEYLKKSFDELLEL